MKEKLNNRYFMLSVSFVICVIIIVLRLVNLQIVEGEQYNIDSQKRVLKESTIFAPRGKILDRYGVPIAINRQGFSLQIIQTKITTSQLNEMLLKLIVILEKNNKSYNNSLGKYLTFNPLSFNGKSWQVIKSWEMNKDRLGITKESDVRDTPEKLFKYLRNEKFLIDKKYTDEEAYKIMKLRYMILIDNWNYSTGGTVFLANDVGIGTASEIEERHAEFSGILTDVEPVRQYLDATIEAHVVGYVGAINQEQLELLKNDGYENNDIIGQIGVEKAAEQYLRGKDGTKTIEVDTGGRLTEQQDSVSAIPGSDVVLTIDCNLQKVAMESLERNINVIRQKGYKNNFGDANAGSVVALDVNTGEVLVMGSYPSFDPQIYIDRSDNKEAQKAISDLNNDTIDRPLFNRAITGIYAPGSTFKPLTAIAALESGVITPTDSKIEDRGKITLGNMDFFCLEYRKTGHGWLDLKKALETSCNVYFHTIGYNAGIDNIDKWAWLFGLGKKTGIDLPGEVAGYMSSKEVKKQRHNGDDWRPADTAQVAIGQFDNAFTPLQLASYISSIANGGKKYKPYTIKKVIKYDGTIINETKPSFETIPVKQEYINAIKEGMIAVTSSIDGTANQYFKSLPFDVAGKTGTAQTAQKNVHSDNGLFVCYAPADNPKIAIAVVVERGVWGSYTAPIARDIIDEYFGLNKANNADESLKPDEPVFTQ